MRHRFTLWASTVAPCLGASGVVRGAAPAPPTYLGVEQSIAAIRQAWSAPGAQPPDSAQSWNTAFNDLIANLRAVTKAASDADRLQALSRVEQSANSLPATDWPGAAQLHQELQAWLLPRQRMAQAAQALTEAVTALPATADAKLQANRTRWVDFVQNDLGRALREYDAAGTVLQRQTALAHLHDAIDSLRELNKNQPWPFAAELEQALDLGFNQPNFRVSADVPSVAPFFERNLVVSGPVTRKGYTSQVTAGPKTGFGLLDSDDGIAFYNKQTLVSVTPIWDFQNQIAADRRGRLVARLYEFFATTYDWSELTITTVLRTSGLEITPSYTHCIDADISSQPACGGELGRKALASIGLNQQAINRRVYEGAIGQFRERIPAEALEEAQERIAVDREKRNADLRSKYLVGNDSIAAREFLVTGASLSSRPDAAFVSGLFGVKNAPSQRGAPVPRPARLETLEPGVTADIHLGSLLSNLAAGADQFEEVRGARNVMIVTRDVPAETPLRDAVTITKNVDFPTFAKAVADSKKARSPSATAVRITRPDVPPEFSTDARGFLVAVLHDLDVEVPAPPREAKGGAMGAPAQIYRIKIPQAELVISYQSDVPDANSVRIRGKLEEFTPGPNAQVQVWAIDQDEAKAVLLSRFSSAVVTGALITRVRNRPLEFHLDESRMRGYRVRAVSPLDPTGWQRVTLARDPNALPLDIE